MLKFRDSPGYNLIGVELDEAIEAAIDQLILADGYTHILVDGIIRQFMI